MAYESTINFTFDTICPWTYIAKKRLDIALERVRATNPPVIFTYHFSPYILHSTLSTAGQDKYAWYQTEKFNSSPELMGKYTSALSALGRTVNISFKHTGTIASTFPAHRVFQYTQSHHGPLVTDKLLMALYRMYFEEEAHPSSHETLVRGLVEAGVEKGEAERVVSEEGLWEGETKRAVQEQVGNGVDSVPVVSVEGRRRDLEFVGAREVEGYVKGLETVIKESQ